ncbi:MAG: hypothetical protein GY781_13735 [Gammaproteobacteria bacterium]|nr:hypothetical protein [Gammaproteobacteria bacterium]
MTITSNPVRNQYTSAQDQTIFNYTFKIYSNQDLNVYLTPAGQDPDDNNDLITSYTVDPGTIGNENGGFITLDVGANSGDTLTIVSDIAYDRETDYQVNGDFSPDTVNGDVDRAVSLIKQNLGLIDRAVLSPESGSGGGTTIPSPQEGQGLKWESGNLVNTPIVETVTTNTTNQTLINLSGNDVVTRGLKGSQNVTFSDDGTDITIFAQVQGGVGDVGSATDNEFTGANSFQSDIGVWAYILDTGTRTIDSLTSFNESFPLPEAGTYDFEFTTNLKNVVNAADFNISVNASRGSSDSAGMFGYLSYSQDNGTLQDSNMQYTDSTSPSLNLSPTPDLSDVTITSKGQVVFEVDAANNLQFIIQKTLGGSADSVGFSLKLRKVTDANVTLI